MTQTKVENSKAALIKLTDVRINDNTSLSTFVENAKAVTIPLFPETVQFTDSALKYGAAIVSVNLNLDSYGSNKDVYKNESGGYCLHLSKINEIAQQAGVQITDSRILERKVDERGRVTFIEHQVKGRMRSVDGSIKEDVATGKYDYFRDCEKYVKKDGTSITGMINSRRSHAEALAESNAKTRLFNKLVAKLPSSFTLDELKKPFLIPYVIEDPNELINQLPKEEQGKVKSDLVRKRLGLIDTVYPQKKQAEEAQVITADEDESMHQVSEANVIEEKPMFTPEEKAHNDAETYRDAPVKERVEKIITLYKLKGIRNKDNSEITVQQVERAPLDKQIEVIEKLLLTPDPVEDLP
jgi:hypothetical protein